MKLDEIPAGQVYTIVCPRIETMMCGAYKAGFFPDGKIELVYEDGEREIAQFSKEEAQEIMDAGEKSMFPIVSAVQSRARHEDAFSRTCRRMQGIE